MTTIATRNKNMQAEFLLYSPSHKVDMNERFQITRHSSDVKFQI